MTKNKLPGTVLVKVTQKHKKRAGAEDDSLQDVSDNSFEIIVTKFHYISLKIQFIDENNRKEYVFKKFMVDGRILLEDDKDSNFTKTVALKNLKTFLLHRNCLNTQLVIHHTPHKKK